MQGNVSLRGLEYLHSHDEEKSLPMLVASGLADHLLVQPEAKRFALAQDTLHDDPSETLTAVETAKGVLLFEYSGFGKTCCHAYMQHLADRFFITDEEKPEFVNLYKLTRPDAEVVKAFQASPNAFSLYTNSFLPEKAQYLDATILRNARLDRSHRIEPTFDAYDKFASSYNVLPSIANAQILRLLSLQETAGIYGIDYTTRRIPFIHKNSFNSQFNALQNIPAENKGGQEKVKSQIRDQAAYILKRDYGLIPDSLQNKEIDPIIPSRLPKEPSTCPPRMKEPSINSVTCNIWLTVSSLRKYRLWDESENSIFPARTIARSITCRSIWTFSGPILSTGSWRKCHCIR